jgi:hypothetical protein
MDKETKAWLKNITRDLGSEELKIARREYPAVVREAEANWRRRGVPEHRLDNKANWTANCWMRGFCFGQY